MKIYFLVEYIFFFNCICFQHFFVFVRFIKNKNIKNILKYFYMIKYEDDNLNTYEK